VPNGASFERRTRATPYGKRVAHQVRVSTGKRPRFIQAAKKRSWPSGSLSLKRFVFLDLLGFDLVRSPQGGLKVWSSGSKSSSRLDSAKVGNLAVADDGVTTSWFLILSRP
jgi:hypothetical protein